MTRSDRRKWVIGWLAVCALPLTACATGPGAAAPEVGATSSATISTAEPSAAPSASPAAPDPVPTTPAPTQAPYNGQILVASADANNGALEVTAMVPGVSESTGTCILEMPDDAASASVPGTAGNGVTYCGVMRLTPADADPAAWTFRVRYESDSTRAESALATLESVG